MDQTRLLKDLRGQVAALETDLRERSESVEEYRTSLKREYAAAHKARRIAATYTVWRDERITQVAVAWVLATVFVRFCEDNELIESPWIAGPAERLREAEDRHNAHFQRHPEHNDRDWLIAAIHHLAATNETVAGLFDKAHNPLWELEPSYEAATALLTFWRRLDPDGKIVHDFTDPEWNTRFLGDLYQNLSESARKTYALLQTPEFVEEFILDLTLEPAIKEFGLSPEWRYRPSKWPGPENETPTGLRTIDPACGSGHFLLGIFHRLLEKWKEAEPGTDRWELIRRTLESVHGCDKNPFAVAIARFRLLLAALKAAGETRLDQAPHFPINIAVGDSLLHGRGAAGIQGSLLSSDEIFLFSTEDVTVYAQRRDLLGKNSYHVVVGNPPYITVKDKQENENYRNAYRTCSGGYSLSVPFAERIFELAILTSGGDRSAGFTGQITANSFMKREFGRKLIHPFFTSVDLTNVIDTSGAYIPGHGTPTVILVGRNRLGYQNDPVRTVLGIRGEPSEPEDAAKGLVWTALTKQINRVGSESDWISVSDLPRKTFSTFPWNLSGGGAQAVQEMIEASATSRLGDQAESIGRTTATGEDEIYFLPNLRTAQRLGDGDYVRNIVVGDSVRDFVVTKTIKVRNPYLDIENKKSIPESHYLATHSLWPARSRLEKRVIFGKSIRSQGRPWTDHLENYSSKLRTSFAITFAFVSTHNHFAYTREGQLFNRSAPMIKLLEDSSENDHLALLGILNSSTACFWLKQVSHDKGSQSGTGGFMHDEWERFYEFTGTKLQEFPIPNVMPLELGRALDHMARDLGSQEPSSACLGTPTRTSLDEAKAEYHRTQGHMIGAQEELDWTVYHSYRLLTPEEFQNTTMDDLTDVPEVHLGERAFEIVLARSVAAEKTSTVWFDRHGSTPVTEIPERWPEEYRRVVRARIALIEKRRDIALIERPEYKRRWASEPWETKEKAALESWMLDRCEREEIWFSLRDGLRHPRTLTISQLSDRFRTDEDMQSVAALYAYDYFGTRDLPLVKVLEEIVKDEHVPYLAALRYRESGLSKRADWEHVWEKQREEDRSGNRLGIAVPPKYTAADFRRTSYWSNRGKLDVPKERFISYPGASPDADDTLLLGWAGWDHKDQAQALVNLVNDRTEQAAWDAERLTPLLAGLLEVMPWVHQWHGDYDADWEGAPAEEFQAFLDDQRGRHGLTEERLRAWRPAGRGRKKRA